MPSKRQFPHIESDSLPGFGSHSGFGSLRRDGPAAAPCGTNSPPPRSATAPEKGFGAENALKMAVSTW